MYVEVLSRGLGISSMYVAVRTHSPLNLVGISTWKLSALATLSICLWLLNKTILLGYINTEAFMNNTSIWKICCIQFLKIVCIVSSSLINAYAKLFSNHEVKFCIIERTSILFCIKRPCTFWKIINNDEKKSCTNYV